jgi:hypothetical protein
MYVSARDLNIPTLDLPAYVAAVKNVDRSWEYVIAHRYINEEVGRENIIILFWK